MRVKEISVVAWTADDVHVRATATVGPNENEADALDELRELVEHAAGDQAPQVVKVCKCEVAHG